MRRRAVIAGALSALLAVSGCAGLSFRRGDPAETSPDRLALCRQLSQQAQAAIDTEDWETARIVLDRLVNESPTSAEAQHRLGRVLQAQGRFDGAEVAYRKALELDPEYADALIGLSQVEASMHRFPEALDHIATAIEMSPSRSEAHLTRGQILQALGRTDDALAAYFRPWGPTPPPPPPSCGSRSSSSDGRRTTRRSPG